MHVLQSNGYIFEDICLKRYCIWLEDACCRDFLFTMSLPSRSVVPSTLWNGYVLMFQTKQCIFIYIVGKTLPDRNEERSFQQKCLSTKECYVLKRNSFFWLSECYTFWMKVLVCTSCTCQLELLLEMKDSCLIVFCGEVIYSVFTAFFRIWGLKVEILFI